MTTSQTLTPLSAEKRQAILNDVLDWELDTAVSKRTERARRLSSQRIAEAHGVTPFQVGGIRSNMAAGRYGTMKTLRARRRKQRNA